MKIEIEVVNQEELAEFEDNDGVTWACAIAINNREPVILTSDNKESTTWDDPTWRDGV